MILLHNLRHGLRHWPFIFQQGAASLRPLGIRRSRRKLRERFENRRADRTTRYTADREYMLREARAVILQLSKEHRRGGGGVYPAPFRGNDEDRIGISGIAVTLRSIFSLLDPLAEMFFDARDGCEWRGFLADIRLAGIRVIALVVPYREQCQQSE